MIMTTEQLAAPATTNRGRAAVTLAAAGALTAGLNLAISRLAVGLGVSSAYPPLSPAMVLGASVVGVLVAIAGWALVRRLVAAPGRALRIVVPVALVLSLVPDVIVLSTGAIPGTTAPAVAALMSMHVVIAVVMVAALSRALPVRTD